MTEPGVVQMRVAQRAALLVTACLLVLACGDSGPTPTGIPGAITATMALAPVIAAPGDTVVATVTGVPAGGAQVTVLHLRASGLITANESLIVVGGGSQSFSRAFILPFQPASGSVTFVGSAESGSLRGTAQQLLSVYDSTAPAVSSVQLSLTSVEPDDSLWLSFTATDNAGIVRAVVRWTGAFVRTDTVTTPVTRRLVATLGIRVPATAAVGRAVDVTVEAADVAGHLVATAAPPVTVTDRQPPSVTGSALGSTPGGALALGDTLIITVSATDNHRVAWLGYTLAAPASRTDSFAVAGASATHTFRLPVVAAWAGVFGVSIFARDSLGNISAPNLPFVTVVNAARRPTSTLPLTAPVRDIAYDQRRGSLYLSLPDSNRVAVVRLAPLGYGQPIVTPSRPHGVDLTLSGDSLLIALRRSVYLGVVDLTAANWIVDTIRIDAAGGFFNNGPDHVRMASNGQALVTMSFDGSGYGGSLVEINPGTRVQRVRTDAGIGGAVTEAVPLAAAGDRSRILVLVDDSCCPLDALVYGAATDSFLAHRGTVSSYFPSVSADTTGARFLIGVTLFDAALNAQLTYTAPGYSFGPTALSSDGAYAYLGIDNAYVKVRTGDGVELERVLLPGTPSRLLVLPDGRTLVAVVPGQLALVALP